MTPTKALGAFFPPTSRIVFVFLPLFPFSVLYNSQRPAASTTMVYDGPHKMSAAAVLWNAESI